MKKRKTGTKPADFSRVKKKVGKAAPTPSNATQTQFKYRAVHVPTQNLKEGAAGGTTAELVEQLHTQLSKLAHHNSTVRKDALLHTHHLLSSHPSLHSLELSALLTRSLSTLTDTDKPVRNALLTLLAHLLPSIPPPTFQPFVRLYTTHTCSGLCSLDASIRRTSLAFLALLLDHYPTLAAAAEGELLAAFDVMLRDRVGKAGGGTGPDRGGEEGSERKDGKGGRVKEGRTGVAAEVHATLQFRVLLLQCIQRFVSLLAADATSSAASEGERDGVEGEASTSNTSSILSLPEPSSFSTYAASLRVAATDGPTAISAATNTSDVSSLSQLTIARPTPLKYARKSGSTASGKPTKKATITSIDDTQLLASLDSPSSTLFTTTTTTAAASSSPTSAFTAAVPLAAFVQSSVPLLVEYWLESLGGDESAAQHSNLTTDSYQCAQACVAILHTYTTLPSTSGSAVLQPFFGLLSAHVFERFPIVSTASAVSAGDVDLIASINVHICHLIASFVPPASLPLPSDSKDGEGAARGESKRRVDAAEVVEVSEWTSEMLEFISQSLFQSSSAAQTAAMTNGAGKGRKRKKWGGTSTALLSSSHIGELLPIIGLLVDRLPVPEQQWLLDAFTTYYAALHELSPAKVPCIALIASLLQPPTGTLCLSLGVGQVWLHSLPSLLGSSARCRPAIIRLLHFVMRCWHDRHRLDLSTLVEQCTPFYCEHLTTVSVELQMAALSLLPYANMLSAPLLSAFAATFNVEGVDDGVRCLMLEMVAVHRHHIGVGAYLSFLLSCLSPQRSGEEEAGPVEDDCHPYVKLVLVRLRELASDEVLLQLLPTSSPRRSPAELLLLLLSPTLQSLLSSAADGTRASDSLYLTPFTLLTLIRCLCDQVRQNTRSDATAPLLPPSLVPPLSSLLSATLLSPSLPTASPAVSAVVSLLCSAPFLVPTLLSRLLSDVSVDGSGRLCDVLLGLLHSRLRKWLLSGAAAIVMGECVKWLQQAGGVDTAKLQAMEMLL